MLNLEAYVDLGHITLAKMATVLKEWDNESIEEALDEDIQEDLVSFTHNVTQQTDTQRGGRTHNVTQRTYTQILTK